MKQLVLKGTTSLLNIKIFEYILLLPKSSLNKVNNWV